jgi:hypothetical protein
MNKNLVLEVMKLLGVGADEPFIVNELGSPYKFDEKGKLWFQSGRTDTVRWLGTPDDYTLLRLLYGEFTITKIPYKPQVGERFYSYYRKSDGTIFTSGYEHDGRLSETILIKLGYAYRTEDEAIEHLPEFKEWLESEEK